MAITYMCNFRHPSELGDAISELDAIHRRDRHPVQVRLPVFALRAVCLQPDPEPQSPLCATTLPLGSAVSHDVPILPRSRSSALLHLPGAIQAVGATYEHLILVMNVNNSDQKPGRRVFNLTQACSRLMGGAHAFAHLDSPLSHGPYTVCMNFHCHARLQSL